MHRIFSTVPTKGTFLKGGVGDFGAIERKDPGESKRRNEPQPGSEKKA